MLLLIILKTLKDLHFINKAKNRNIPKVDVCFNDLDELKIEKLKKNIIEKKLHYAEFGKLNYRSKDYKSIVPVLANYISKLKNEKAFVFIDPYGYKEIRASEIKDILSSKKAEVLLFLPTQFMYRFDEKGTPKALIDILEELVDLKDWKVNNSVYGFIEQFNNALRQYLGKDFFVDTFTIQKDESTVYCLFFFSSHIRGFEKMLETKWEIDQEHGKGWSYEKTIDLFSFIKINSLEEKVVKYISENDKVTNGDIYEFILRLGFLPKHINEVFAALQNDKKLNVFSTKGENIRKGAFYISYENYKKAFDKIYFKII
ncbi:MAG: three-Cys-motif partner protein TcmP [Chitinophagaceae bacterium]|nr:three-Cys-motif partner protein TcmP [Chitinophagaceae bacterium]